MGGVDVVRRYEDATSCVWFLMVVLCAFVVGFVIVVEGDRASVPPVVVVSVGAPVTVSMFWVAFAWRRGFWVVSVATLVVVGLAALL